jgi:hypothetical protein
MAKQLHGRTCCAADCDIRRRFCAALATPITATKQQQNNNKTITKQQQNNNKTTTKQQQNNKTTKTTTTKQP